MKYEFSLRWWVSKTAASFVCTCVGVGLAQNDVNVLQYEELSYICGLSCKCWDLRVFADCGVVSKKAGDY